MPMFASTYGISLFVIENLYRLYELEHPTKNKNRKRSELKHIFYMQQSMNWHDSESKRSVANVYVDVENRIFIWRSLHIGTTVA